MQAIKVVFIYLMNRLKIKNKTTFNYKSTGIANDILSIYLCITCLLTERDCKTEEDL